MTRSRVVLLLLVLVGLVGPPRSSVPPGERSGGRRDDRAGGAPAGGSRRRDAAMSFLRADLYRNVRSARRKQGWGPGYVHGMIVVVAAMKGGVGKTTTAVYLAALAVAGRRDVALVDADPQASAADWLDNAPDTGIEAIELVEAPTERLLGKALERVDRTGSRSSTRRRATSGCSPRRSSSLMSSSCRHARRRRDPSGRGGARHGPGQDPGRSRDVLGPDLHP